MKILVLNAEAGGNKGAEAMLETLITKISEEFNDGVTLVLEVASNFKYYEEVFLKKFTDKNITFELLAFKPRKILNPYEGKLKGIDMAIDIGGINFHDGSNRAHLRNLVRYWPLIKRKKKLIFFTQDIGPSSKFFTRIVGRTILKNAAAIFTRSKTSYDSVVDYFKIDIKKVKGPFPDATLLYSTDDKPIYTPDQGDYVVLSPSAIMYVKHGEAYLQMFVDLFKELRKDYCVIGLVHNFTKNNNSSDAYVLDQINHRLNGEMTIINQNVSTGSLKSFLSNAKFIVSSRYHVVVGAVSKDVPGIAIGWNPKYASFLSLYGKEKWNIDFNADSLQDVLILTKKESFINAGEQLKKTNKKLKQKVENSFNILMELLKSP
jgi:polysaccharide pyruvyl transferase WcaK-like protein